MALTAPYPVSRTRGRARIHCPAWHGGASQHFEQKLLGVTGVRTVQANGLTRNVLVFYDEEALPVDRLIAEIDKVSGSLDGVGTAPEPVVVHPRPAVVVHQHGAVRRARITVRGLDRDPQLGARIMSHLAKKRPGVRATVNPITSRMLVEFPDHLFELEEICAEIAHFELPGLPEEDLIHHPLDPGPLVQGTVRVVGAAVGLGMIAARRLLRADQPLLPAAGPARIAGLLGLAQGFPIVRVWLRRLLGRTGADLLLFGPIVISLALSESVLGLALTGIESVRLLTEVLARRQAWERYESRLSDAPSAHPGAVIRIDSGQRTPLTARVVEGAGTGTGRDGLPVEVGPGSQVSAGARLFGGPFVVELVGHEAFDVGARPAPATPTFLDRYIQSVGLASLGYAGLRGLFMRSWGGVLEGLMLVNPRTAVIGSDFGDISAFSRILRGNVVVVGTRHRSIPLPDTVLLDSPRSLTEGYELAGVVPLESGYDQQKLLTAAGAVAGTAGCPWGSVLGAGSAQVDGHGTFDGRLAIATIDTVHWTLGPAAPYQHLSKAARHAISQAEERGCYPLLLHRAGALQGLILLRPRLVDGVDALVEACKKHGVHLALLTEGSAAAEAIAMRARIEKIKHPDGVKVIRQLQANGQRVAYVADDAKAGAEFAHCDLAIGLSAGRGSRFPARADLLAPDIGAVALIIEASSRQRKASRDSVLLSMVANVVGAVWGLAGQVEVEQASVGVYIASLVAATLGWARLHGGERPSSILAQLADPRPERWGARSIESVLQVLQTSASGLTTQQAMDRVRRAPPQRRRNEIMHAMGKQLRSPLAAVLAVAAGLALALGATVDFVIIVATIGLNTVVGTWQEVQTGRAAEALERIGSPTAKVLRDGHMVVLSALELVTGDIMVLGSGDRIAADGRVLEAHGLEVDEAALTGESHPVAKLKEQGSSINHIVLEGSDVVVGTGRAIVTAVGRQTRLGATAAALALQGDRESPLGQRLSQLLHQLTPVVIGGGLLVVGSGLLRQHALLSTLAVGASIALASVPEGLPLLAGIGEAAVARRLSKHGALVRRLTAVEALGRVDVACTDKTGTLTTGKLALRVVAFADTEVEMPLELAGLARQVLLTAALASPHPDASDANAHPTDVAVVRAAVEAGLMDHIRVERQDTAPFDPKRSFHGVRVNGNVCLKGAPEALAPLCVALCEEQGERVLDDDGRAALLHQAEALARRGLRVLMVARGPEHAEVDEPQDLVALGFLGLSDPLRPHVKQAVQRCQHAGVRIIMLTGDHASTARVIATEAGVPVTTDSVLTGTDLSQLSDADLDVRMRKATVIARATPLDKLRIIESLRRNGHTIAMTGDGVNDAPALRLADVGVAMGKSGTEVARQAADMVLLDDDFATLVLALVEGRSFWRNMRRALGLLLGGNLGELGVVVGASVAGSVAPLTTAQILAVNLMTDALPALSVVLQGPESRNLSILSREGMDALDRTIRRDVVRRGTATALPALVGFLWTMQATGSLGQARSVAFASVVATQLAQTLDIGMSEGGLTPPVMKAVVVSTALLVAMFTVPVLHATFELGLPGGWGWPAIAAGGLAAVLLNRTIAAVTAGTEPGPEDALVPLPLPGRRPGKKPAEPRIIDALPGTYTVN